MSFTPISIDAYVKRHVQSNGGNPKSVRERLERALAAHKRGLPEPRHPGGQRSRGPGRIVRDPAPDLDGPFDLVLSAGVLTQMFQTVDDLDLPPAAKVVRVLALRRRHLRAVGVSELLMHDPPSDARVRAGAKGCPLIARAARAGR